MLQNKFCNTEKYIALDICGDTRLANKIECLSFPLEMK